MAGQLVQVATETVSSPVASVTLTGIDSDDVYMLAISGVVPAGAGDGLLRVTKSGTADTTANYDRALKGLRTDTTFTNLSATNATEFRHIGGWSTVTTSSVGGHSIVYLYNFNSSSEYSFISSESATMWSGGTLGAQGGGVHTVASASDGIHFTFGGDNIASGTFTLYKVV
jgi:hypothetical protein